MPQIQLTLLSQGEDKEQPGDAKPMRILTLIAFATAAILVWIVRGLPTAGVAVAFGVSSSTIFGRTPRKGPVKKQVLEMLLGLYWLAAVIGGGAHDGSVGGAIAVSFGTLVVAWLLAMGSQYMIRWLRKA